MSISCDHLGKSWFPYCKDTLIFAPLRWVDKDRKKSEQTMKQKKAQIQDAPFDFKLAMKKRDSASSGKLRMSLGHQPTCRVYMLDKNPPFLLLNILGALIEMWYFWLSCLISNQLFYIVDIFILPFRSTKELIFLSQTFMFSTIIKHLQNNSVARNSKQTCNTTSK